MNLWSFRNFSRLYSHFIVSSIFFWFEP